MMITLKRNTLIRRLSAGAFGTLLLTSAMSSCATVRSESLIETVAGISADLVEAAEVRINISSMRLWVEEIHRTTDVQSTSSFRSSNHDSDVLGTLLEHEFVVALSRRVNLVDTEAAGEPIGGPQKASLGERASFYKATHVLVGDYVERGEDVLISIRLIDAETHLIVAAASGLLPRGNEGPDESIDPRNAEHAGSNENDS